MLQVTCESDQLILIQILFLPLSYQLLYFIVVGRSELEVNWIPRNVEFGLKQENMELERRCLALKDTMVIFLLIQVEYQA